ncbi:DNA cross-link repair protein [Quillaja saponaria]|uniref:DNA cross-link repair protein n=1 Tax=Quillaja saponaria TaxID=32244 RepID=A0AAD7PZ21_QUISA|nr:DNA cross-link repair protein [Quillaja saponaria]KAJ7971804.1 DNA cross-link repair protein [Quillaja saponaria]
MEEEDMPLFADATTVSSLVQQQEEIFPEDYFDFDDCDYDHNRDYTSSYVVSLDENGFPQVGDEDGDRHSNVNTDESSAMGSGEDGNGFASDFYRCGTDWSCLVLEEGKDSINAKRNDNLRDQLPSERKLKQSNLFQMWGFKRSDAHFSVSTSLARDFKSNQNGYHEDGVGEGYIQNKKMKTGNWGSITRDAQKIIVKSKPLYMRKSIHDDNRPSRACPFYKKITGTPFTVDAFRYGCIEGCSAYFLTHFHYDHYGGLSKGWSHGPIYCSPRTARLVRMCLSVNPSFIIPLDLNTEHVIEGVKVTLLEANHCPGAALIHFHIPNGQCYLHTGDFRACKEMQGFPLLISQRVNVLYLDTTYCDPKYKFPSKEDVLSYVVKITKNCLKKQPRTLVVVGAYSIGKECVYLAISKALGVKIFANASRRRTLLSFGWPELSGSLCTNEKDTLLHVLPISSLKFENLKSYLKTYHEQYAAVLAFRPTGWTYRETVGYKLDLIKPSSKGNITIYGVPYSEHSSFTELQEFVQFLRPQKIIPTVNISNAANREKMQSCFRAWLKG